MITGHTRLYAIIGDPIEHVRTPMAFNDWFAKNKVDAVCLPIHIGRDDLPRGWAGLRSILNLDGFIVTAPHKGESKVLCDSVEGDGVPVRRADVDQVPRADAGGDQRLVARQVGLRQLE